MTIQKQRAVLLTVMRNEGPYILEWLAHYFSLGFDDLVVFTNDCTDNTDLIFDRLEELMPGKIKHQPNPKVMFRDQGRWHIMALRYAGLMGKVRTADWIYVTDADEFLKLNDGMTHIDQVFEKTGPVDAISFTSTPFNSSGHRKMSIASVPSRFTQTVNDLDAAERAGTQIDTAIKTLYNSRVEGARRPHRPVNSQFSKMGLKWVDGSGKEFPPDYIDSQSKTINAVGSRKYGQVNHYSIKSMEEFLLKVDRGDAVQPERLGSSVNYWQHADRRGGTDDGFTALSKSGQGILNDFLSDPALKRLHEDSYAKRAARLDEILRDRRVQELARQIGYYD